jgi:hypothetical protein
MVNFLSSALDYNWWVPIAVFVVAVVAIIAWAAIYVHRLERTTSEPRPRTSSPTSSSREEQALLWRFASGQIDAGECRDRLYALGPRGRCCRH